jgi:hypothetical protein
MRACRAEPGRRVGDNVRAEPGWNGKGFTLREFTSLFDVRDPISAEALQLVANKC